MANTKGLIEFIEWLVARKLAVKTVEQYARHYKLFEKELGDKDLTKNFLDRFVINHPSNISRSFLKNLFDYYKITSFEVPKIKGRKKKKKRRSMTPEERRRIGAWLFERRMMFGLMFEVSYFCALRREEVISIRINDFELQKYSEDPSRSCKLKIHGKGSRERYVIVPPKVMERVITYMQQKSEITLNARLFKIGKSKWHEVFKDGIKQTGSYNFTLHDLRRSRATYWLDHGVDLVRVSRRLGHSDVSTTQRYINVEEEKELKKWEEEY